jgi:hypothetical protein
MPRRLLLTLIALGLALAVTAPASAGSPLGTLDQQQTDHVGSIEFGQSDGVVRPVGQTFTAGLSGALDTVALYPVGNSLSGAELQIRSVSGGLPTSTILASETVTSSATDAWVQTTFAAPATVVATTQYAIVLVPPDSNAIVALGFAADVYASGRLVVTDFPTGLVWGGFDSDYAFQTYVTVPPAPAASTLPNAAMADPATGSPLLTLGFALLLIGSLGTLALATARRR